MAWFDNTLSVANRTKRILAVMLIGIGGLCSAAVADSLKDGNAAYNRKDYATALKLWQVSADKGNAEAQADIGGLYFTGEGVQKDYAAAMTWNRKAAVCRLS